jgi:hypothetical protein
MRRIGLWRLVPLSVWWLSAVSIAGTDDRASNPIRVPAHATVGAHVADLEAVRVFEWWERVRPLAL